jgi:hypothetical protein
MSATSRATAADGHVNKNDYFTVDAKKAVGLP